LTYEDNEYILHTDLTAILLPSIITNNNMTRIKACMLSSCVVNDAFKSYRWYRYCYFLMKVLLIPILIFSQKISSIHLLILLSILL